MSNRLIVFVCTGNICRSPMAEYLLRDRLGGDSGWEVASAGVMAGRGMPASRSGAEVLAGKGIDMGPHTSRPLDAELVDDATLIVVMTTSHREQVLQLFPSAREKVFLLKSFDSAGNDEDVDDPIGATIDVYHRICGEIESALPGLIEFMERLQNG